MAASGGKPTRTREPAKPPRRKSRRDSAMVVSVSRTGYRHYKLSKAELRAPEPLIRLLEGRLVLRFFGPPVGVAEQLFHDALLAHRLARQAFSQFPRCPKIRVRKSTHRSHGVDVELVGGRFGFLAGLQLVGGRINGNFLLLAELADRIELFQTKANAVDQG